MAKRKASPAKKGASKKTSKRTPRATAPRKSNAGSSVASALAGGDSPGAAAQSAPWFSTGWEPVKQEIQRADAEEEARKNRVKRFWMPASGESALIVMVSGLPFNFREHSFVVNGKYHGNEKTCLVVDCPFCNSGNEGKYMGAYTIIDTRKWQSNRDKKWHKNEVILYCCGTKALKLIEKIAERRGHDLTGWILSVARTSDKSPVTGDSIDPIEQIDLSPAGFKNASNIKKLEEYGLIGDAFALKGPPKPINYVEALRPMTREAAFDWLGVKVSEAQQEQQPGAEETVSY